MIDLTKYKNSITWFISCITKCDRINVSFCKLATCSTMFHWWHYSYFQIFNRIWRGKSYLPFLIELCWKCIEYYVPKNSFVVRWIKHIFLLKRSIYGWWRIMSECLKISQIVIKNPFISIIGRSCMTKCRLDETKHIKVYIGDEKVNLERYFLQKIQILVLLRRKLSQLKLSP